MNAYEYWTAALAGEKPKMYVDDPMCGFYRKGVYARNDKGNNKRIGWTPVAIFMDGGTMVARVGSESAGRDISGDALNEIWSYVADNPISEETYRNVASGEPWPDAPAAVPAANREVAKDDNAAPEVLTDKDHAAGIDNAIAAAVKVIKTEDDVAPALGSKNRIAELRLAADKAGKALYDPPYRDYKRLHCLWSPMVAKADTAEKTLQRAILTFREQERQRIAREQAEADAKQREIDEANERAAQRSIAAGEPEQPPEVVEIIAPAAPAPILPTYGTRKLKEEMKTFLDEVTDFDQVYGFFKTQSRGQVEIFLKDLAERAIRAGFTVPGTTTRQGLI